MRAVYITVILSPSEKQYGAVCGIMTLLGSVADFSLMWTPGNKNGATTTNSSKKRSISLVTIRGVFADVGVAVIVVAAAAEVAALIAVVAVVGHVTAHPSDRLPPCRQKMSAKMTAKMLEQNANGNVVQNVG